MSNYKVLIESCPLDGSCQTDAMREIFAASAAWMGAWMVLCCRTLELQGHFLLTCRSR